MTAANLRESGAAVDTRTRTEDTTAVGMTGILEDGEREKII